MSDVMIGMSIDFDKDSLNVLENITNMFKEIDKKVQSTTNIVNQFANATKVVGINITKTTGEFGVLQKSVEKLTEQSRIVTDRWKDNSGVITEVTTKFDRQGKLLDQNFRTINNIAQIEKEMLDNNKKAVTDYATEVQKKQKFQDSLDRQRKQTAQQALAEQTRLDRLEMNKLKNQEKAAAQDEKQLQYIQRINIALEKQRQAQALITEQKIRSTQVATGEVAGNTYLAQLSKMGWSGNRADSIMKANMGDILNIGSKNIKDYFSQFGKIKEYSTSMSEFGNDIDKVNTKLANGTKISALHNKTTNDMILLNRKNGDAFTNLGQSLSHNIKKIMEWTVAGTLLFGTLRLISDGFKKMKDLEMQGVNIGKVLPNDSNVPLKQLISPFEKESIRLAKEYGQSVLEVETSMASWARRYKEVKEVSDMTTASLLAATATDISFEQSVTSLSALMSSWNLETSKAIHLVDILNEVSNSYRVTAGGVSEALSKASSSARVLGLSIEELTGITTTMIQSLGMEGDAVGTVLVRVFGRIRGNDSAVAAINKLGINAMGSLSEIMDELLIKWDLMSDAQKQSFAITVGGTQHWSRLIGLLNNGNTMIEATAKSYFSYNSAQREVDNVLATTTKHLTQLNASWEEYIQKNNSVLSVVKSLADGLRYIVQGLSETPPVLTLIIIGTTALTVAFLALRSSFIASNLALGAFTKTLLSNPWTAAVVGVAALATYLFAVGKNASQSTNAILDMQIKTEKLTQGIEGNINKARGIENLSKKYDLLKQAVDDLHKKGQQNLSLEQKMTTVQTELAKALGLTSDGFQGIVDKDGVISEFSKRRIQDTVDQINAQKQLQWQMQQMYTMQGISPELSFLTNFRQVTEAFEVIQRKKEGKIPFVGSDPMTSYTNRTALEKFQKGNTWSERNPFYNELEQLYNYVKLLENKAPPIMTVDQVLKSGTGSGGQGDPGDDGDKKLTANILADFQEKWSSLTRMANAEVPGFDTLNEAIGLTRSTLSELAGASDFTRSTFEEYNTKLKGYVAIQDQLALEDKQYAIQIKDRSDLEKQLEEVMKTLGLSFEDLIKKTDEYNQSLIQSTKDYQSDLANRGIDPMTKMIREIQNAIENPLTSDADKTRLKQELPKLKKGQIFETAVTGLDLLIGKLGEFNETTQFVASQISTVLSKSNFDVDKGIVGIGASMASGDWITMAINGIMFLFSEMNKKPKESGYKPEQYDIYTTTSTYTNRANDLNDQINVINKKIADSINPAVTHKLTNDLVDLQDELAEIWDGLTKALGTGINNIAASLESAFSADTYMDFLTNWNQSLYKMTRDALVKGFLAEEAFQNLYKDLSKTITLAVIDGKLTGDEIAAIKTDANAVSAQMSVLYQALDLLKLSMPGSGDSENSEKGYSAGVMTPIQNTFYISVNSQAFMGSKSDAKEFALMLWDEIQEEMDRT